MMENTAWCHGGHQDETDGLSVIQGIYNLAGEINM